MRSRIPAARRSLPACDLLLISVLTLFPAAGLPAERADIALQCRFSSGLSAIYIIDRNQARVRRADVLQPRTGRFQATVDEYRFIFQAPDSAYRIDVVIDRATGNTRRVFGTRRNMARMPEQGSKGGHGLVYEAGQCEGQYGGLR